MLLCCSFYSTILTCQSRSLIHRCLSLFVLNEKACAKLNERLNFLLRSTFSRQPNKLIAFEMLCFVLRFEAGRHPMGWKRVHWVWWWGASELCCRVGAALSSPEFSPVPVEGPRFIQSPAHVLARSLAVWECVTGAVSWMTQCVCMCDMHVWSLPF